MMLPYNPTFGNMTTLTLAEVFPTFEKFEETQQYMSLACPITGDNLKLIYLLLISRYGESHIASSNWEQFRMKLMMMVGSYAPAFLKRIEVQKALAELDLNGDDLLTGVSTIMNHAENPNSLPTTQTLEELTYIDGQNTTKTKLNRLTAYSGLLTLLDSDLYGEFLARFAQLFVRVVMPQTPFLIPNDYEEGF